MPEQTPKRIQRKRTKGWRMPANTVYVGRPTKWGNPFKIGPGVSVQTAVAEYRAHCNMTMHFSPTKYATMLRDLRGKDLACWCKEGEPCHADVLLELANADQTTRT